MGRVFLMICFPIIYARYWLTSSTLSKKMNFCLWFINTGVGLSLYYTLNKINAEGALKNGYNLFSIEFIAWISVIISLIF